MILQEFNHGSRIIPFEDPKVYTRPFKMALAFGRTVKGEEAKSYELLESACYEGDRNMQGMPVQAR